MPAILTMDVKPENLTPVSAGKKPRTTRLVDEILRYGDLAYNPELPAENKAADVKRFQDLISGTKTLALIPALTTLVQPGRTQEWLRLHISRALALLPLRPQGVRHTIEFVLSVHPSTSQRAGSEQSQTAEPRGPSISLEALNSASRLISSPPSDMSPDAWYSAIAPQLLSLLDGEGGEEMIKVAAFIIGYGVLGRKALGAPGTPGWKNFAEPITSPIDPSLGSQSIRAVEEVDDKASVVPLIQPRNVLVTASKLAEALRRLSFLLSSHPNPGLSKRLLEPLLLPLWSLSSWVKGAAESSVEQWKAPARFLLRILLQLSSGSSQMIKVAQNILYQGNRDEGKMPWSYVVAPEGGIQISKWKNDDQNSSVVDEHVLEILDEKIDGFIELVKPLKENDDVPALFLLLCRKWLLATDGNRPVEILLSGSNMPDESSFESRLVEIKIMQKLMDSFPNRLVSNSTQILDLAVEVLNEAVRGTRDVDDDDTVSIALSLVNMVFSAGKPLTEPAQKHSIRSALEGLARQRASEASTTAQNLLLLLDFQMADSNLSPDSSVGPNKDVEDRRTYSLAHSYLTGADSPPPVRAQGLDLISSLIAASSPVLDIPATLILVSSLLQDEEDYIYLRAIKTLIQLSIKHPKAVMLHLLERYIDADESVSLDSRLRIGEALLQVVQKAGQTFTGDVARQVGEGLLSIAGRRGYRPKHEAEQQKKAELKKSKIREAEQAWEGPVPELTDGPKDVVEDPLLTQIVEGWEGKLGEEDVRVRASALSIFGSAIETNVAGLGSALVSDAVDLAIHILTLEPEHEKAVLRRAATLLIMSLVIALDRAQEEGKKLGFGFAGQSLEDIRRILRYISETDNDGLVRMHAKDVIEGLTTWQMKGLMSSRETSKAELGELSGLSIGSSVGNSRIQRPRIEEIE